MESYSLTPGAGEARKAVANTAAQPPVPSHLVAATLRRKRDDHHDQVNGTVQTLAAIAVYG